LIIIPIPFIIKQYIQNAKERHCQLGLPETPNGEVHFLPGGVDIFTFYSQMWETDDGMTVLSDFSCIKL